MLARAGRSRRNHWVWAFLFCLLVFAVSGVEARQTPAGTVISNFASVTYQDANANQLPAVQSNTVTTVVSQVAGVALSPASGSQSALPSRSVFYPITVVNTGNGSDTFALGVSGLPAGWTGTLYYDANGNGILDLAETTTVASTGSLAQSGSYKVVLKVSVPANAADNTTATATVTATSAFRPTVKAAATFSTLVTSAVLTTNVTASITSPKPGDVVTYTVTITNSGTAAATDVKITDLIPAGTTYVPGSILFDANINDATPAASLTDAADADKADYNGTTAGAVTAVVGSVDTGVAVSVSFQVTVGQVEAGSYVSNAVTVDYSDAAGAPQPPLTSTSTSVQVAQKAGVSVAVQGSTNLNATPGDTVVVPFTITNTGNGSDLYYFDYTSTRFTWTVYRDVNGDGKLDEGDVAATDSDNDGKPNTAGVERNGVRYALAVVQIPAGTDDLVQEHLQLSVVSKYNTSVTDSFSASVTNHAPHLTITKSVSPTGAQEPGTLLTYTITVTNTGSGLAKNVTIQDTPGQYLEYKANSITVNGVSRTDAASDDAATFTGDTVTVEISSIGHNGEVIVTFGATIR